VPLAIVSEEIGIDVQLIDVKP